MAVNLYLDWSGMVYSCDGSSDLSLLLSCMTSNFLWLSFSTLHSSSLRRTDTIVFAKLIKPPPSQINPSSLLMYTSIRQTPRKNGHLEFVLAFLHTLYLTLYETDISQRPTLSSLPKGVPSYIYIYFVHVCIFM